jgi:diguanylate cyclase
MRKQFLGLINAFSIFTAGYFARELPVWAIASILFPMFLINMMFFNKMIWKTEAMIDPLTECGNRRSFDRSMTRYWNTSMCAITIDVDNFKHINDTFGHTAGDDVLKQVGRILKSQVKETVYRYGGEEFVVLLPDVDIYVAHLIANRLCAAVSQNVSILKESVTISVGVASGHGAMEALKRSDKAMYEAKEAGKNQVCSIG